MIDAHPILAPRQTIRSDEIPSSHFLPRAYYLGVGRHLMTLKATAGTDIFYTCAGNNEVPRRKRVIGVDLTRLAAIKQHSQP